MTEHTKPLFAAVKTPAEELGEKMVTLLQHGIVPWYTDLPAVNLHTEKVYEPLNQCLLSVSSEDRLFATASQIKARGGSVDKREANKYNVMTFAPQAFTQKGYVNVGKITDTSYYKGVPTYHVVYGLSDMDGVNEDHVTRSTYNVISARNNLVNQCSHEAAGMKNPKSVLLKRDIGLGFLGSLIGKPIQEYDQAYIDKWIRILSEKPTLFLRAARMAGKSVGYLVRS